MKYYLGYSRYGLELQGKTREELIQSYINVMGGAENVLTHFLNNMLILKDNIQDAKIINNDDAGTML